MAEHKPSGMITRIGRPDGADVRRIQTQIIGDLRQWDELYQISLPPAFMEGLADDLEGLLGDGFLAEVAFIFFRPTIDPLNNSHLVLLAVLYEINYGVDERAAGSEDEGLPFFTLPAEREFDVFLRWTPSFLAMVPEDRDLSLDICTLHIRPAVLRLLRPAGWQWTHPIVYHAGALTAARRIYMAPGLTTASE